MTYEKLVETISKAYDGAQAPEICDHLAIQFDVCGDAAGAFYIEVAGGEVTVAPYDYMDRDILVKDTTAETIIAILNGKKSISDAIAAGEVAVDGDAEKITLLEKTAKKGKAEGKKAPVKKSAAKSTAKKTTKTTAKKTTK